MKFLSKESLKTKFFKKTILIFIIITTLILSGCYGHEDAEYECQISVDSLNSDCSALAGRVRTCQILDMTYGPGEGISSYCTGSCLKKSKFLDSVPKECLKISVAYSRFSENANKGLIMSKQLTSENAEVDEEIVEKNNIGETKPAVLENIIDKKCEFNSECKSTCEGFKIAKQYCDINTYKCKFDKYVDCSLQSETIVGRKIKKSCIDLQCKTSILELQNYKDEISKEAVNYNKAAGQVRTAIKLMDDIAIGALEGMFAETLQTTFEALNIISGNPIQLIGEGIASVVTQGMDIISKGDDEASKKPEMFAWALNNRAKLRSEVKVLEVKFEETKEIVEKLDLEIKTRTKK